VRLTFCFFGEDFDPDEITRRLGIHPTESWRRGDPRGNPKSGAKYPRSGWRLVVGPQMTLPIDGLLAELRQQVDVAGATVRQMCENLKLEAYISCGVTQPSDSSTPMLEFPPDFMAWAISLGASVGVDFIITA
jgi:hypothetical protein